MRVTLEKVVLLAAPTSRSQAYIQTLVAWGLCPESVIFMGRDEAAQAKKDTAPTEWEGMLLPDLNESVISTCKHAGIPITFITESNVNTEMAHRAICATTPNIIIYSGVGGQIVSKDTLALGPQFLHMHSGWLPEFRGSTTIYYAMLRR